MARRLSESFEDAMEHKLSHINPHGEAHMVDVSAKAVTTRKAVARGFVHVQPETLDAIVQDRVAKGSVLATARIAGVLAAKKTADLIPLCHSLGLDHLDVRFGVLADGIAVEASATCQGRTGVEMEALTAVSVACLTIYDMAKALDKEMVISDIHLVAKTGGKSGPWNHPETLRDWPEEWG
jgi:cyclic pyranopterin phosphate synthase